MVPFKKSYFWGIRRSAAARKKDANLLSVSLEYVAPIVRGNSAPDYRAVKYLRRVFQEDSVVSV